MFQKCSPSLNLSNSFLKVGKAVVEAKKKVEERIFANSIPVHTKTVKSYVLDVCAMIQAEVHMIEINLFTELNQEYQNLINGKKGGRGILNVQ